MSNENISTAIATLFSNEITEQGLSELRERFPKDVVHDMTDDVQFKSARKDRTERNKLIKAINDRRIGVTGQLKTKGDDLVNNVELIFSSVVGPFEAQLEVNKIAKEKAERELEALLDGQRDSINNMNNFVAECVGKTSKEISDIIESVDLIETTIFHKDIIHEAIEVKKTVQSRLAELLTQALNEESLAQERAKLAEQQELADKAQRIADLKAKAQERLNNLMMIPTGFFGKTSKEINAKVESLKKYEALESEFGELYNQANSAKVQVISQLEAMANQQKAFEDTKAQQDQLNLERDQREQKALEQKPQVEPVSQEQLKQNIAQSKQNLEYADSGQARENQQRTIKHLESQLEPAQQEVNSSSMAETMAKGAPTLSGFNAVEAISIPDVLLEQVYKWANNNYITTDAVEELKEILNQYF